MNNFTKVFFETKNKLNSKGVLFFFFMLLTMQSGWAQTTAVSITTSSTITDNVGSYAGTAGTLPSYWGQQGSLANGTNQAGANQTGGTAGGWYGSGTTNNGGMSFLGSKTATNGNGTIAYQNNTGNTITGFTLAYTAKMFNNSSGSPTVSVSWSNANTLAVQTQGALTNNLASLAFSDATASIASGVTLTQTVSSITIANGQYIYIRWIHSGGSNSDNLGWNAIAFTPTFTASSPTADLADNGTQISAASLSGGTTNAVLHQSKVTVTNGPVSLTGMGCTTTGTYASSDITNLKLWYQATSTFSSGSATLLSTYTTPDVAGAKTFPSFTTQSLPTGTGYLFITADVAAAATAGNTIALSALTTSNLTASVTPTGSTSAGGTQTFLTNYYWNGGTIATNPAAGGSGKWDTANSWRVGSTSGAQAAWAANNAAILAGTAGTIDLGTSDQTAASIAVNTTGYTLTSSNASTKTLTGPITLANSVNLNLNSNVSGGLTLGSITGGTSSSLTLTGTNTLTSDAQRINLSSGAVIAASAPITISTTGSKGLSGFVNPGSGTSTINAAIANSSGTPTMLGAVSGGTLTIGGLVSGTSGVQFSAGTSNGSGTVNMNVAGSSWTGPTYFNGGNTGIIKLGIANGISTNSDVTMGYTSGNGQVLDLNGLNQTFKSLASVSGGTGSITNNATGTSTLTVNQSSNTSFGLPITNGGGSKIIALTKSDTGTLTMTGTHTFTGATTITGGYIAANNESSINGAGTSIVLNGGGIAST